MIILLAPLACNTWQTASPMGPPPNAKKFGPSSVYSAVGLASNRMPRDSQRLDQSAEIQAHFDRQWMAGFSWKDGLIAHAASTTRKTNEAARRVGIFRADVTSLTCAAIDRRPHGDFHAWAEVVWYLGAERESCATELVADSDRKCLFGQRVWRDWGETERGRQSCASLVTEDRMRTWVPRSIHIDLEGTVSACWR